LTGSARCSLRWDQSGSRAPCSGSRSTPPPESPRSTRSPAYRYSTPRRTHLDRPASPLQYRPVRRLDRTAILDEPPRDLLGVAARCGARSARLAHMDRPRRQRPHGPDRPSRRGRGRAARAHRPGTMGRTPRPDRTGPHGGRRHSSCSRRNSASPSPSTSRLSDSSASASSAPGYRRGRQRYSSRASGRSSQARPTTRPTPSSRSPAAPGARWPSSFTSTARNSSDTHASRSPDPRKSMPVFMKTSNQRAAPSRTAASGTQPATMSWGLIPARERKRVLTHAWPRTSCSPQARISALGPVRVDRRIEPARGARC
jgi:hypothetical protein